MFQFFIQFKKFINTSSLVQIVYDLLQNQYFQDPFQGYPRQQREHSNAVSDRQDILDSTFNAILRVYASTVKNLSYLM